jgi:hypothetical protein
VSQVPVIDVHAHVLLPGVDEAVAGQPRWTARVDIQLISPSPSNFHAVRGGTAADLLGLH